MIDVRQWHRFSVLWKCFSTFMSCASVFISTALPRFFVASFCRFYCRFWLPLLIAVSGCRFAGQNPSQVSCCRIKTNWAIEEFSNFMDCVEMVSKNRGIMRWSASAAAWSLIYWKFWRGGESGSAGSVPIPSRSKKASRQRFSTMVRHRLTITTTTERTGDWGM